MRRRPDFCGVEVEVVVGVHGIEEGLLQLRLLLPLLRLLRSQARVLLEKGDDVREGGIIDEVLRPDGLPRVHLHRDGCVHLHPHVRGSQR
jgi:hypothetical protein